jgi:hypothetical protein
VKGELIVAVTHSNSQLTYSVITIPVSGWGTRILFRGSVRRSYSGIAMRSLRGPIILRVREQDGNAFTTSLINFNPADGKFIGSCLATGPTDGMGILSPDGKTYAYANALAARAAITFVTCNAGGQPTAVVLTDPAEAAARAWYTSLSWSPGGRKMLATRVWQEGRRFQCEVRLVDREAGKVQTVLPAKEGPIASVFVSEDKAVAVTRDGLVVVNLQNGETAVVFPRSGFKERRYMGGGIAWMPKSGSIAISLRNPETDDAELWRISLADGSTKILYKQKAALFINVLCIGST